MSKFSVNLPSIRPATQEEQRAIAQGQGCDQLGLQSGMGCRVGTSQYLAPLYADDDNGKRRRLYDGLDVIVPCRSNPLTIRSVSAGRRLNVVRSLNAYGFGPERIAPTATEAGAGTAIATAAPSAATISEFQVVKLQMTIGTGGGQKAEKNAALNFLFHPYETNAHNVNDNFSPDDAGPTAASTTVQSEEIDMVAECPADGQIYECFLRLAQFTSDGVIKPLTAIMRHAVAPAGTEIEPAEMFPVLSASGLVVNNNATVTFIPVIEGFSEYAEYMEAIEEGNRALYNYYGGHHFV